MNNYLARILNRRWYVAVAALGLVGATLGYTSARADDGCGPVDEPIIESKEFTPANQQLSSNDSTLNRNDESVMDLVADLSPSLNPVESGLAEFDGMPLWWIDTITVPDGISQTLFYLDEPTGPMLESEFMDAGGVLFYKNPAFEGSFATAEIRARLGERGVAIEVGPHDAVLVYADPAHRSPTRTHNLYWSDGEFNYALIGVRGPEEMINLGRSLVCS